MKFKFDSHGGDIQLDIRTGQTVEVLRELTEEEADIDDVGKMFAVRFEDGFETDVFADELTLDEFGEQDEQRTYTVTEMCPHCETEVEMRWDTDTQGFKAFCPVCGKRLMLCDECHQLGGGCDYDSKTDSCQMNPATVPPGIPQMLRVETPLGAIIARVNTDPDYPGIWIDLRRQDADQDMQLAMVEFCKDEGDRPEGEPNIVTRVWADGTKFEYTDRIIHGGIEEFFRVEDAAPAAKKNYSVYVSLLQYGYAHVEASSPEEAKEKARKLYEQRGIDWHDDEITDMEVQEE